MSKSMDLSDMKRQYVRAVKAYYNADKPIMTDKAFDKLENAIRAADPNWENLKKTGTRVATKRAEIPLLYFMPSLNKRYEDKIEAFYDKKDEQDWLLMDKLDGTSLQLAFKDGRPFKLITRGDGKLGGDVSHLLPALVDYGVIPASIPNTLNLVFRIEALMELSVFEAKWSKAVLGDKKGFDNPRNMVNGLFNRQAAHPALKDVHMVVLGQFGQTMIDGLGGARAAGFEIVRASRVKNRLTAIYHTALLTKRRKSSQYEMDGLVIAPSNFVLKYRNNDKPKELVAFKINDEESATEVKVEKVIWQKTRLKRWIGKIQIPPTRMGGVTVVNATAHNAKWMMDRGIGPGAIVKVLRSGDVIPKIVDVVKPAKFEPPPGEYVQRGVHFLMTEADRTSVVRSIHHFMVTLGIETLAVRTLDKLYDAGFTTAGAYIRHVAKYKDRPAAGAQFFRNAGIGQLDSSKKMAELIRVLGKPVKLLDLMVASGCFEHGGMGRRKLEQLEAGGVPMSKLVTLANHSLHNKILEVPGFKDKTATIIVNGMANFIPWLAKAEKYLTVDKKAAKKAAVVEGPLNGINVSWTTYRSKEQEALVTKLGGAVITFGAKTTVLLYDPNGKASNKVEKAGDRAMTWDRFVAKYKLKSL